MGYACTVYSVNGVAYQLGLQAGQLGLCENVTMFNLRLCNLCQAISKTVGGAPPPAWITCHGFETVPGLI